VIGYCKFKCWYFLIDDAWKFVCLFASSVLKPSCFRYQDLPDLETAVRESCAPNQVIESKYSLVPYISFRNAFDSKKYINLTETSAFLTTISLKEFDTSCFSGTYVTGEDISDSYFSNLHELRNDEAQTTRNSSHLGSKSSIDSKNKMPMQSYHGCETVSNDRSESKEADIGCDGI